MAQKMKINLIGVVENMSYVTCGKCGEKIRVFSKKSAEEQAKYLELPLLAEMPIDLELVESMELRNVESYISESQDYATLLDNFKSKIGI